MEDLQKELYLVKAVRAGHIVKLIGITISLIIFAFGCAYLFAVSDFILLKFFSVGWFALTLYGCAGEIKHCIRVINMGSVMKHLVETFEQIRRKNKPLK